MKYLMKLNQIKFLLILGVLAGCGQSANQKQEEMQARQEPVQPAVPKCEVEMSASTLKNSLLAPSENLKYTALKLHELAESHDHARISEQAISMSDESIKLMKSSAYLNTSYLDSLIAYSSECAVLSNALQAHNTSMNKSTLQGMVGQLESLAERVSDYTSRKVSINEGACLTNMEMLENEIRLYFNTLKSGIGSIESFLGSHCEDCATKEIAFYENLMKLFREVLIKAPTDQYKTVSRTLADIEHTLHELSGMHEEDAHHTMETLERQMDRFEDELLDITGRREL
jgi:hypothetical protein